MRKKINKDELKSQFVEKPESLSQHELIWLFKNTKLYNELLNYIDSHSSETILFSSLKLIFKKINDLYHKKEFISNLISKVEINQENHDKIIDVIQKYNISIPNTFVNLFHKFINEDLNQIKSYHNNLAISSLSKEKLNYDARLKLFHLFYKTNYTNNSSNLNSIFIEFLDFDEYVRIIKNLKDFDSYFYDDDINLLLKKFDNSLIEELIDDHNLSLKHVFKVNRWLFTTKRYDLLFNTLHYNKSSVLSKKTSILKRIDPSDTFRIFKDHTYNNYGSEKKYKKIIIKNDLIDLSLDSIDKISSPKFQEAILKLITPDQFKKACHEKLPTFSINSFTSNWFSQDNSLFILNNVLIKELISKQRYNSYNRTHYIDLLFKNLNREDLINSKLFHLNDGYGYEHIDLIVSTAPHILTDQEWVNYLKRSRQLFFDDTFKKIYKRIPTGVFKLLFENTNEKEIKAHLGDIRSNDRKDMFAYIKECISSFSTDNIHAIHNKLSMNPNHVSSMVSSFNRSYDSIYYLDGRSFGELRNILFSVRKNKFQLTYFIEYLKDKNFYNDFIQKSDKKEKMTLLSHML